MQTLHKFIASASMKKIGSLPAQEPGSPKRLEVQPAKRITSDAEVSAAEVSEVKPEVPVARWQSWDFSDPVYNIEKHPICRSRSRKLTDLGAPRAVEYPDGHPSSLFRPQPQQPVAAFDVSRGGGPTTATDTVQQAHQPEIVGAH